MTHPRSGQSLDMSDLARAPFAATRASIAAGQRAVDCLGAAAILNAFAFQRSIRSFVRGPAGADLVRPGTTPGDTPAGLAAYQHDMAFALALMSFDVGTTWLQRFSAAMRA
jgi:alkylation response protein AidB-like acyl-CoA dehydrogenase